MENQDKLEEALNEVTAESQYEILSDAGDTPYLDKSMLTDGTARNIVTVKITTKGGSFVVDVLKVNPLHRIYKSENRRQLIEVGIQPVDAPLTDELLELNYNDSRETLLDYIIKPKISLKGSEDELCIDEIPTDVQELLLGAYRFVNNQNAVNQAVRRFPE